MKPSHGLIAAALLALAVPVCAQALGELAKREAERRKTLPVAVKTYTNDDLKKLPPMAAETGLKPAEAAKAGDPAHRQADRDHARRRAAAGSRQGREVLARADHGREGRHPPQ